MARQQKCNLVAFYKEIKTYKNKISLRTWTILQKSGLWPIINPFFMDMVTEEQITKKEIDIAVILQHYDNEEQVFKFGEVTKQITQEDVNRIFGLPMKGKDFQFEKRQNRADHPLIRDRFKDCKHAPTKTQVDHALYKEMTNDDGTDPEHVASLLVISLFTSFLFANSASTIS